MEKTETLATQETKGGKSMNEKVVEKILSQMIEVELPRKDSFLILKETLTRIGVPSTQNKTLYQSCHILHKRGKYYITHFKLLFELDGRASNFDEKDRARMNTIASLLESWGLIKIKDKSKMKDFVPIKKIKIIPASEKHEWNLVAKHRIGKMKNSVPNSYTTKISSASEKT